VAIQALNLPLITQTSAGARAFFTISFMLAVLSTFFTCIQQREFGMMRSPLEVRDWLSSGVYYHDGQGRRLRRSSMAALNLLELPYEFLSIAIANLVGGMATYLGSAWVYGVSLSVGSRLGDVAIIVGFAVVIGYGVSLFPLLLGYKSREIRAVGSVLAEPGPEPQVLDDVRASGDNTSQP
jgi:hypothetical protein